MTEESNEKIYSHISDRRKKKSYKKYKRKQERILKTSKKPLVKCVHCKTWVVATRYKRHLHREHHGAKMDTKKGEKHDSSV